MVSAITQSELGALSKHQGVLFLPALFKFCCRIIGIVASNKVINEITA